MATIFDLVNAPNIAAYYINNPSNNIAYLGRTLFPPRKQLGLELGWIKGSRGVPVALKPSNFDAKATVRDRIGVSKVETEMPFFREAMLIKEKDRQQLNTLLQTNNDALITQAVNIIYDDAGELIRGADVQPERMIMQLLSTGIISIEANRVDLDYNYGMSSDHKETLSGTALWSDPDATPIQDIQGWQDKVEDDTGTRPTNMILTRKTWNALMAHPSIRLDMNPLGGQNVIPTDAMIRQYLLGKFGLSVAVYNKKYKDESGTLRSFYPDDYVTMIPDGQLGNTWYGTTPEESDLLTGNVNADVQIVNTGVAVTTVKNPHPVNVETIVSEIVLPSFETIDNIFIAKVL